MRTNAQRLTDLVETVAREALVWEAFRAQLLRRLCEVHPDEVAGALLSAAERARARKEKRARPWADPSHPGNALLEVVVRYGYPERGEENPPGAVG